MSYKSETAHKNVQQSLDSVTSNSETGIAGLVFAAINKDGDLITANASGKRGLNTDKPMTLDTIFWIASCTKMIAAIAIMQLVEQGKLDLDDHKQLYKLCPELEKVKVLENGKLVERKGEITLRMLLTHTAGFGYEFFNEGLRDYGRPIGFDVFGADMSDILRMPLVNQPGTKWEYGINIDWAGIALERLTGKSLNDYMQENIFKPLGIETSNMFPSKEMKSNLASMHQRWPDSSRPAEERDHVYRRPLVAETPEEKAQVLNSGGAGLFSRPTDYVKVLAALLNDGTCPKTNKQILKPETVKEMLKNQIPDMPNFGRQGIPPAKAEYTVPLGDLYPQEEAPQGWCLSAFLTVEPGPTGRGKNTIHWAGIANLFWWLDHEKGVAGMIASQVEPFGDPHVGGQWGACEAAVYASLNSS